MTNESQQQPSSTLSDQTVASPRFAQVLALGRKLVDELGMEPSVDTLGRWMAHYVAELIDAAANATPVERGTAEKRCFDAILELWRHRAEFPDGRRPFEDLDSVARTIASLNPDNEAPRYFPNVRGGIVDEDEVAQTRSLLGFVRDLDFTAKLLIGHFLAEAASSAADKGKEWIKLAEDAAADRGPYDVLIRYVSSEADLGIKADSDDHERAKLLDRKKRLEAFVDIATHLSAEIKGRLEAQPGSDEKSSRPLREPASNAVQIAWSNLKCAE